MSRSRFFGASPIRGLLTLIAVSVLSSTSTACWSNNADRDTVVFWAMGSEAEVADTLLDGFRRQHPEIPIRVQRVPWSAAHEKLLTAYVGDSMPDVFQLGNTWVPELAMLGALLPLEDQVAASTLLSRDDFFAGTLAPNEIDGHLVALPWYVDTRLLFYRRDILAEVGVLEAPDTWAKWRASMEAVRKSRAAGSKDERYGVALPIDEWQTPVILAMQQGAELLRDDNCYGNFRSPEMRRAVEFYVGLFRDDLAPRKSEAQVANVYREFAAGYFAFFVTGPWNLAELDRRMPSNLANAWTTAPMPAPEGDGPGLSVAGGASLAVSASSPRKESAFRLVEYLSSTPVQVEFHALSGDLPSRRSAWNAPELANDASTKAFRRQLDHLAATPKVPEWERIAAKLKMHMERMIRGDAGIDEALADLDEDVDSILAKRRTLRAAATPAGVVP